MSIKGCRFLWIKLRIENKRFTKISFPVPLYILRELLDCLPDMLTVACFFAPKKPDPRASSRITVRSVNELAGLIMKLPDSLTEDEPYDLVDVTTDTVKLVIQIR